MECGFVLRRPLDEIKDRPTKFSENTQIIASILPDHDVASRYVVKTTQEKGVQAIASTFSAHEVNTEQKSYDTRGINHQEGGWPKDVNPSDPELVGRFRKRIEKDDNYIYSILKLAKNTEMKIRQNITIDIYQEYFTEEDEATMAELEAIRPVSGEETTGNSLEESDEISR